MKRPSGHSIEKRFTEDEMMHLLERAAQALLGMCKERFCDPPPPERWLFFLHPKAPADPAPSDLLQTHEVVKELVRPDGSFREWINLSPLCVIGDSTVIEVDYPERFTTRLLAGEIAFRFEPFLLLGPPLPLDWREGDPVPKVALLVRG